MGQTTSGNHFKRSAVLQRQGFVLNVFLEKIYSKRYKALKSRVRKADFEFFARFDISSRPKVQLCARKATRRRLMKTAKNRIFLFKLTPKFSALFLLYSD